MMMNINMQNEVDIYSRRNYTMNVGSLACQKKEVNHMSGQIHIKGSLHVEDGTYIVRARVPDPVTGKVRQRSKSTKLKEKGNNKRRAEQAMREILAEWEAEANRIPVATTPLFSVYVQKYLDRSAATVRENTLESYRGYAKKHILPALGNIPVGEITRQVVQAFYDSLIAAGLKPNSVQKIGVVASGAAHLAVLDGVISRNVFKDSDIELPKREKFRGKAYTQSQAIQLLNVLEEEGGAIRCAGILAIYYGLRRSEVCGLRWCDIDFEKNEMYIRNTVTQNGANVYRDKPTKTEKSRRTLTLVPATVPYLKQLKQEQIDKGFTLDKVCRHPDGREVLPNYITRKNRTMLKAHGMEPIRFHDYRATCASLLASHVKPKQLQELLGHEQISTTMEIYVKAYDEDRKAVAATMDGILGNCV